MIENENNSLISYDEGITDKQVKFLSSLFSQSPKKIGLKTGEKAIYDLATQYFVFGELNIPIYGDFAFKILINKIVKEVWGDFLDIGEIDEHSIDEFRKYFYRHPDFTSILFEFIDSGTELKMFNEYLKYVIEYKILKDEDLNSIREVRKYLYMSSGGTEQTGNLFDDLYNFLHFYRFVIPGGIDESERKAVLNNIVEDVNAGEMENPLEFKTFKDRNKFPDKYLNAIEKLVLKTYTYDPLKHTVKTETCKAIDKINLQILKDSLSFNPRGWQRYDLIFESRENLVANCRRTGKSFLAVYLSIRQIMLPQQLVLYILPNKEGFSEQPFYYIEKMFDNLKTAQGIEGNIPGLQFNNKTFKVINKELKSKILFISAVGGTKGGRSFSANLIIMDEAGYTEDADMYDVSYSATTDTRGRMWAISTINKDTPINRFFYKKIDLDGGNDSIVTSVDIYNNEFIPDDEKIKLEQKHKIKNPKIWLSEYMAIFVGQGDTFDISGYFRMDFDYDVIKFGDFSFKVYKKLEQYTRFMVNRDPGRDVDPGGLTIIGIKNRNQADVVCSGYMRIPNYIIQANAIIEIYEYFKKMKPTDIVLDLGKVGIGMLDYMNSLKVYPYGVTSTGGNTINNPSPRQYNMSNVILEGNLKNIMNTGILRGFSRLENIRHEFETYEASKTRQGTQHHHDILSSLMIGISVSLERNWLSFRKAQEELPKSDDELLYETMAKYQNNENNKFLY